ncbi:MAG: HAD family hydrolase [Lachnospiraceae bacterium]|nr:HAD family hydrolase [Lachnospiraceae bacterium]
MYQNYIFDLYGTLVDTHTNENKSYLHQKLAAMYASYGAFYTPKEWKSEYQRLCREKKAARENPHFEIELTEVFAELFTNKGIQVSKDTVLAVANMFRVVSRDYLKLYDFVLPFFGHLKKKGKGIYLLSNAQTCFTVPEIKALKLYDLFDGIVISSEVGVCKPDTRIMDELITKYHLDKSRCIMIGNDRTSDIRIAIDSGLDSLYMHSNISPQITEEYEQTKATYEVLDGDFSRIEQLILL